MLLTNDFYNANTGLFDPRHMYGVTNQDVFRWPGIVQGTERLLLGYFITTLLLPGIRDIRSPRPLEPSSEHHEADV
jgi:alpha-1,3-glucan synthase